MKTSILFIHALVGWALCGAIIGVGRSYISMELTLIIHAIGAPIIFFIISGVYFKFFNYTTPLFTALFFTLFVISTDLFVVALLIEKSLDMFMSFIGTWLPFILIFSSTLLTGLLLKTKK